MKSRSCSRLLLILSILALFSCGCSRSSKPSASKPKPTEDAAGTSAASADDDNVAATPAATTPDTATANNLDDGAPREQASSSAVDQVDEVAQAEQLRRQLEASDWTRRRLVALAPGGPVVMELAVSIGTLSLQEANRQLTAALAEEVFQGLEEPVQWNDLLDQPLIQSGWLGNLIADEDQVDQLVGMYDVQRDDVVTLDELGAFLSRGLARNASLIVDDIGAAPDSAVNQSPWGRTDLNQDHTLDESELSELSGTVMQFDFNGDTIVSAQEINQAQGDQMAGDSMSRSTMLETSTLATAEDLEAKDPEEMNKAVRQLARTVLQHYTFLDGIPRQQWSSWPDSRWELLDANQDQLLQGRELDQLATLPVDVQIYLRFPAQKLPDPDGREKDSATTDGTVAMNVREQAAQVDEAPNDAYQMWAWGAEDGQQFNWQVTPGGGRIDVGGCSLDIAVQDAFSGDGPRMLKQQLSAALKEPQLQAFFRNQLQLQDDSFELLDADGNEQLDDKEFDRVWRWLSSRQSSRLLGRWMTSARPWFQLMDADGDRRLTPVEVAQVSADLRRLDANQDDQLTPNEMPLMVQFEINRTDRRLQPGLLAQLSGDEEETAVDGDWFSAMDTNRDGFVSGVEFLGDTDDFDLIDANKDGFLERSEVYGAFGSY